MNVAIEIFLSSKHFNISTVKIKRVCSDFFFKVGSARLGESDIHPTPYDTELKPNCEDVLMRLVCSCTVIYNSTGTH